LKTNKNKSKSKRNSDAITEPEEITIVVFRRDPDGTVVALFPYEPSDNAGFFCSCYEYMGGHHGADYHGVISKTRPATPEQYEDLKVTLERIGYRLRVCKRVSGNAYRERVRRIKAMDIPKGDA
jgi:hypothetical protein